MLVAPHEERPRVLVVDDEQFIRDVLADFLGMEGYLVRSVEDGVAAIGELSRQRYDLVLSDLKMPRMGGLDLLAHIGQREDPPTTIIMTGFATIESAIDAMKRGAYDYVLKPFKIEEVLHVVERGLEQRRLASENLRLREALSLYKVSEAISASLSLDEVIDTLAETAEVEVGADVVTVFLADGEGGLRERASRVRASLPAGARLGELDVAMLAGHLANEGTLLEHGHRILRFFSDEPSPAPVSIVGVPLRTTSRSFGFMACLGLRAERRFDEGQRKLLSIVAGRASAAIENARLYEDLQATFHQTIEGLAKAIDKMDRYTAGHSERVARYAVFLGEKLALSPAMLEILRQSALLHDIGKIGCVMNLNKTGKLSQEEYEVFKRHPGYGRDILDPIKFLHPLVPGVHLHHEMWNGKGYPLGLAGNDIPLVARIIAVADTYDAMTSDRAYRRAMPHDVAVGEITRCGGTQFDPEIGHTFNEHLEAYRDERRDHGEHVPD